MMPSINVSIATINKLQKLAVPLIDNYDTVISRVCDVVLSDNSYTLPATNGLSTPSIATVVVPWDVEAHADLTHTRLVSATFGGNQLGKTSWNNLAKYAHEIAYKHLGSFSELQRVTRAHVKQGRYEKEGFVYLPSIDISLQGMDSNMSWNNSVRLAHEIGVSVAVIFMWGNKPAAAHPGQRGDLSFSPS